MRGDAFHWFVRGAALALGAALTVGVLYILLLGLQIVVLVFIALLLASALEPLIDRIRTRTPLQRGAIPANLFHVQPHSRWCVMESNGAA